MLILAWIWGWNKIQSDSQPVKAEVHTSVSILIPARNEEILLPATLKAIIAQNYPKHLYEVIVIDDHSMDNTAEIARSFSQDGVKLISLKNIKLGNSYKKMAIQRGIEAAQGHLIVCTDADVEMGPNWLRTLVNFYEEKGWTMLSAPVAYFRESSFFERCQSLEFILLNAIGAANFGLNKVGSCNGANLAYEKKAFLEVNGFEGIDHLASGDDELLLHKMAAHFHGRQGYVRDPEAIVYTYAKPNWKEFIQQRKRWASKSTSYQAKWMKYSAFWIWVFNLNLALLLVLGVGLLNSGNTAFLQIFCIQFALKAFMEGFFIYSPLSFFKRTKLLLLEPLLSFCHIFYLVYIGLAGNNAAYHWKGRTVK
ncbi:MAG: glycosyltransferase [Pedobacter sp.]|nr:MAG: glycosyltransferase [Pedobacter sp.]